MITAAQIIDLVFSRNIGEEHFKDGDITLALERYVKPYIGCALYDAVVDDLVGYADFINGYILPVTGWGVAVDNFEAMRVSVTDRGIQQMLGEGMTIANEGWLLKKQFALNRDKYIVLMCAYAKENYELYEAPESEPKQVNYVAQPKRVNHV